jgi:uncharacterized protein YqjF (DUF2071 family)
MTQRWNDLLFAHWPVSSAALEASLPDWLEADTFQGLAWLGAVPFWLDRIKIRGIPAIPGLRNFPDLNLRTYVRDRLTGTPGIYFFSVDSNSVLAIAVAQLAYHLPYHLAEMHLEQRSDREFAFYSRRRFTRQPVIFKARYRGLGPSRRLIEARGGTLEYFFTERPCIFSTNRAGQPTRANLHHVPWPLEEAEAEIERNDLAKAVGIDLPNMDPILHYTRRLALYVWPAELVRPQLAARPVTVAATPS